MRTMMVAGMLAIVGGCGPRADPATGPLPVGGEVVVYAEPHYTGTEFADIDDAAAMSVEKGTGMLERFDFVLVPVGTKVRVADDPGPTSDGLRKVRVKVLEGKHADRVGTVERQHLRPLPSR